MSLVVPQTMEVIMKRFALLMIAVGIAASALPAVAALDTLSQQAIRKSQERAQAARAEMGAMLAKCRAPDAGQK